MSRRPLERQPGAGVYDITVPLAPGVLVWPGDPPLELTKLFALEDGDSCTVSRLSCSVHTGTHIDAPSHYITGGTTVDALDLDLLIGPAELVDLGETRAIGPAELSRLALPADTRRLLVRTTNSQLWGRPDHRFDPDYAAFTPEGADWLVAYGIRLVGIDYLSVERFTGANSATHRLLLAAGVVIVEGLDLRAVSPGHWTLVCLPLRLTGCEAAPARAVLLPDNTVMKADRRR